MVEDLPSEVIFYATGQDISWFYASWRFSIACSKVRHSILNQGVHCSSHLQNLLFSSLL